MTAQKGFSLLELMIVVAIIALVAALVVPNFTAHTEGNRVEAAVKLLRSKVERARVLSGEVGPRIGEPNAAWTYVGCAPSLPNGYLWSTIDTTGNYIIPYRVDVDRNPSSPTFGVVTVSCETGTLTNLVQGNSPQLNQALPTVAAPAANLAFAFSGTGRVCFDGLNGPCDPANYPADASFILQNQRDQKRYGFRIFQSGMLCTASLPGSQTQCDTD
jgi:prepilin-type N-terminal cleavage/methylation domain-containing protein